MTYKTGSIGEFMKWTKRVITDPTAALDTPKRWFDSDETAARSLGTSASAEAMVKLLSGENIALLHLIETRKPGSVRALARLAGRKESNLSRTLKKLHEAGIIDFEEGAGRIRAPRLVARRVTLDLDLVGPGSLVSVQRPAARKTERRRSPPKRRASKKAMGTPRRRGV
jgi:predicted transcriptional regulator